VARELLRWFGQGLLTRPSSETEGLPGPDRRRVTWIAALNTTSHWPLF